MAKPDLSKLTVLVVDDFSSFRSTMIGMLNKLGVKKVEEAATGSAVIKWCKDRVFDAILCDYNLGKGKNGQQILEELRYKKMIKPSQTLFLMVTAEASKDMVLSAYDYEPDDYLMKPLNLHVLQQRLERAADRQSLLRSAHRLIEQNDLPAAIDELQQLAEQGGRQSAAVQKMLGDCLLQAGQIDTAEKLFRSILEVRQVDWAALGMAKVQLAKGNLTHAKDDLEALISDSRLYLPAYDGLCAVYRKQGDHQALQTSLQRTVDLSPKSILRQRELADVAKANGDVVTTLESSMAAIKLGEHSCHRDMGDSLAFLQAAGDALALQVSPKHMDVLLESKKIYAKAKQSMSLDAQQGAIANILQARVCVLGGDKEEGKKLFSQEEKHDNAGELANLEVDLAKYAYWLSAGDEKAADQWVDTLVERYRNDPVSMERVDRLLAEPRSEHNRKRVASINREGISHYKAHRMDQAIECFQKAILVFPRHIGLQLNYIQSLIGSVRERPTSEVVALLERQLLEVGKKLEGIEDGQKQRYHQLRVMAKETLRNAVLD